MRLGEVVKALNAACPPRLAQESDNVGLHVGGPHAEVEAVAVALDADVETIGRAAAEGVDLLVTHHPPFRRPPDRLIAGDPDADRMIMAVRAGLALYSAHTNFDSMSGGVSDVLADRLGLSGTEVLVPSGSGFKVAVFVPPPDVDRVFTAMTEAGAGMVGRYRDCSFRVPGTGTFTAPDDTRPAVGKAGQSNAVDEIRLETVVGVERLRAVVEAMKAAHPYEEVAYDVYSLVEPRPDVGLGRIGRLPAPSGLDEFARNCAERLGVTTTKYAGDPKLRVEMVAVCGGSGGGLIDACAARGADVLVCGDIRYHDAQRALALGLGLVDAGHDGTEGPAVPALAELVEQCLRRVGYTGEVDIYEVASRLWRPVRLEHGQTD